MSPPASREDLRLWLVAALKRLAPSVERDVADDTPLAEGGLGLDSLALVDLIHEIQTGLQIAIEDRDVSAERLGTVGLLLDLLASRSIPRVRFRR